MVIKTALELLGGRPLPRVVRDRPVVFLLGPPGSGKTTVAERILRAVGGEAPAGLTVCGAECLRKALNSAARHRAWSAELRTAPTLLLDSVECLHGRYGAITLLGRLLRERAEAGLPTVLCQGTHDASVTMLYPELACELRASVLLRFPEGRGRRKFVAQRCRARGLPPERATAALSATPWSYAAVDRVLDDL